MVASFSSRDALAIDLLENMVGANPPFHLPKDTEVMSC